MKTSDWLRTLKTRLQTCGWQQNSFGDHEGPNCLMGASHRIFADADSASCRTVWYFLWNAARIPPSNAETLVQWNDKPGRTIDEVYALIDTAIEKAEKEED